MTNDDYNGKFAFWNLHTNKTRLPYILSNKPSFILSSMFMPKFELHTQRLTVIENKGK